METQSDRVAATRLGWVDGSLVTLVAASAVVTVLAGLLQVSYGSYSMTLAEAWATVFDPRIALNPAVWRALLFGSALPELPTRAVVVWSIRLPRVFVAALVGVNLAVSGAIFQAVTRNELASPQTLGVNAGAGLAVLLTLVVYTELAHLLPLVAALGGAAAFLLVYAIAWNGGTSPVRLVLAGIIVATVFNSLQTALFFLADSLGTVQQAIAWTTGSLTGADWQDVRIIAPWSVLVVGVAMAGARQLNVLVLGEQTAKSLGMNVERIRFGLSAVAIVAGSSAIAVAGIVGFVGLLVPHVVRTIVGSDYRRVIVGSMFVGPALMVVADVGSRLGPSVAGLAVGTLAIGVGLGVGVGGALGWRRVRARFDDSHRFAALTAGIGAAVVAAVALTGGPAVSVVQMPVGVVTGLIGGPYFLYLMKRRGTLGGR